MLRNAFRNADNERNLGSNGLFYAGGGQRRTGVLVSKTIVSSAIFKIVLTARRLPWHLRQSA